MEHSKDYKEARNKINQATAIKKTMTFDLPSKIYSALQTSWNDLVGDALVIMSFTETMTSKEKQVLRGLIKFVDDLEIKKTFKHK